MWFYSHPLDICGAGRNELNTINQIYFLNTPMSIVLRNKTGFLLLLQRECAPFGLYIYFHSLTLRCYYSFFFNNRFQTKSDTWDILKENMYLIFRPSLQNCKHIALDSVCNCKTHFFAVNTILYIRHIIQQLVLRFHSFSDYLHPVLMCENIYC